MNDLVEYQNVPVGVGGAMPQFTLPTYSSSNPLCPIEMRSIVSDRKSQLELIEDPAASGNWVVQPKYNGEFIYDFQINLVARDGRSTFTSPVKTLAIGCTTAVATL